PCSSGPTPGPSSSCPRAPAPAGASCPRTTMPAPDAVLTTVWNALAVPWQDGTVLRAFVEVGLIGAVGGVLGCWIVLYGLSYGAESLAHALFPGLVAAALLGLPLIAGGAAGLAVAAIAIAAAGRT